jgi:hypothetical protein
MDDRPRIGERVNCRAWSDIIAEAAWIESRHFNHFTSRQGSGIFFGADPLNGQIWKRLSSWHRENDGIAAARALQNLLHLKSHSIRRPFSHACRGHIRLSEPP